MKSLAIVFFYMGKNPNHKHVLDLALKRNPNSEVYLITDEINDNYPHGVGIVDLAKYGSIVDEFNSIYDHKSTCGRFFDMSGILRWIIYYEWWRQNSSYNLFVADSDVMIFSDLYAESAKWEQYSHTLSMGTAGGQSYWFNIGSMKHLVDTIWNTYKNPNSESSRMILDHYDNLQREGKPGGVCDMTFLHASANELNVPVGETTKIVDESTYDHNILMAQEYVFNSQRKEIEWKNGIPYCRVAEDKNRAIRFHTLHMSCSGGEIEGYYNRSMGVL